MHEPYVMKLGQQLLIACVLVDVNPPQCFVWITALRAFRAYTHQRYRNTAKGPSSAYGANTGGHLPHSHTLEHIGCKSPWLQGFLVPAYWSMLLWWPVIDPPPTPHHPSTFTSHWLFATGWWCHHMWHIAGDMALWHVLALHATGSWVWVWVGGVGLSVTCMPGGSWKGQ